MERTMQQLKSMQAAPLDVKVLLTKQRIREWVNEFGTDGVYVSFSGGKDSTVLLHIVREMYPSVPAVFCDTGLEYPEIREFVRTFDNVEWLKPKMSFRQVIEKYGYPFISKELSEAVYFANKYLTYIRENKESIAEQKNDSVPFAYAYADFLGIDYRKEKQNPDYLNLKRGVIPEKYENVTSDKRNYRFDRVRWRFMLDAPFRFSNRCCHVMKKGPMDTYARRSERHTIAGQMAEESFLRQTTWIKNGCNAFTAKKKVSNPMSFWTGQDVLKYIRQNNIPMASVYGEIVNEDADGMQYDNTLCEMPLRTTGVNRTGCMFCGFGCHLEKPGEGRFERMKKTHPKQYEWIMKDWDAGGLGYRRVIDWLNENGNLHIRY